MYRIAVYCASHIGNDSSLEEEVTKLGSEFAARNWELLYGGTNIGLMGRLADSVLSYGGRATGIIPNSFCSERNIRHDHLQEYIYTSSISMRKEAFIENADLFVVLPGSAGTMDEFYNTVVLKQLKQHSKPIILYNFKNYYRPLLEMRDAMLKNGFMDPCLMGLFDVCDCFEDLILHIQNSLPLN